MVTNSRAPADQPANRTPERSVEQPTKQPIPQERPTVSMTMGASSVAAATAVAASGDVPDHMDRAVVAVVQTLVLDSEAIQEFLGRLSHFVADHLSTTNRTILCGITLLRARSPITVASSSEHAKAMDEVQYSFGDGPCLDAARNHRTNYVRDVTDDGDKWRNYRAAITAYGMRSILAVPIPLDPAGTSGCAINLYADTAHAFSAADIETTQRLAREAADTVRIAVRIAHLTDTARDLRAAMDSRTAIDLAAGVIMAQNRCSQNTAVTILKAASSARNLKLHDLALAVVTSVNTEELTTHFDS